MGINRYIYGMFDVYGCVYRYLWYRKPHKDRTRTDSYRPKYCSVVNYRLAAFFGVCWALPKINGAPTVVGCFIVFSFLFQIWRRAAWPMRLFLHGTVGSKPLSSFILNIVYMLLHVFVCVCQPSASFSCRILVTAMESQVHHSCDARDASHAWVLVNPSLDIWTETD